MKPSYLKSRWFLCVINNPLIMITNKTHWIKKTQAPEITFQTTLGMWPMKCLFQQMAQLCNIWNHVPRGVWFVIETEHEHTEPHTRTKRSIEWRVKGSSSDANENWVHVKQAAGAYCHCDSLWGQWIWMTLTTIICLRFSLGGVTVFMHEGEISALRSAT